jgi:hypothetical protein
MARSLRPLDASRGPVQEFAADLRKLWEETGSPPFLQMARKTGKSRTAMAEAVGGDHLPSWETLAAFVTACGGKPNEWRSKWEQVRDARALTGSREAQPEQASDVAASQHRVFRAKWLIPYAGTVLITAVIVSVTTVLVAGVREGSPRANLVSRQARSVSVITVQNKVAVGVSGLLEDSSPSYLSSKPIPFCSHYGCEVPGTQMSSGAMLVAVCYVFGEEMYNYNLDSAGSQRNPYRASSRLWYRAVFPNQRSGYISEVYIVPGNRGGEGLKRCR